MMLAKQVYAQAVQLSGVDEPAQEQLLMLLCQGAVGSLTARLREGLTPEDCKADFVAAASLYALAALSETDALTDLKHFQVGDITIKRSGGSAAARCLRSQAELMMSPYLKDRFAFMGV